MFRTHICPETLKAAGPTPSGDEIAAYLDEALGEEEMARVETHIRGDNNSLAVFDQLLRLSLKIEDPVPSSAHVDALKEKLREPTLAGRLRIFITDRWKQVFHPNKTGERAFGRAMKIPETDGPLPCMEPATEFCEQSVACEAHAAPPPTSLSPSKPRLIDSGSWIIRAVSSGALGEAFLDLTVEDADSGQPVPDIPLRLEPPWDDPVEARTNNAGQARFPLPDGESRLEIGEDPKLLVIIEADIENTQD